MLLAGDLDSTLGRGSLLHLLSVGHDEEVLCILWFLMGFNFVNGCFRNVLRGSVLNITLQTIGHILLLTEVLWER